MLHRNFFPTGLVTKMLKDKKGIYQLLVYLSKTRKIKIGKKGTFTFLRGYYVYTGSAKKGLWQRIQRHLRKRKKLFWHIDYLLEHAQIIDIFAYPDKKRGECRENQRLLKNPESRIIVPGFGSSDCSCPSHLIFFSQKPKFKKGGLRLTKTKGRLGYEKHAIFHRCQSGEIRL